MVGVICAMYRGTLEAACIESKTCVLIGEEQHSNNLFGMLVREFLGSAASCALNLYIYIYTISRESLLPIAPCDPRPGGDFSI